MRCGNGHDGARRLTGSLRGVGVCQFSGGRLHSSSDSSMCIGLHAAKSREPVRLHLGSRSVQLGVLANAVDDVHCAKGVRPFMGCV